MLLFSLTPDTYLSKDQINGYSSLIWTERYLEAGEFELRTPFVDETRALLPEDTLVAIKESREVMIVETHEIEENDKGAEELVVKGRSFETFLENRFIPPMNGYRTAWKMQAQYASHGAALALIWDTVVNPSNLTELILKSYGHDTKENLPNVRVSQLLYSASPNQEWWLEAGPTYAKVLDFLVRGNYGIRSRRPPNDVPGTQMRLDSDGNLMVDPVPVNSALWVEVYNGRDRTRQQTALTPVIFHHKAGHLEQPKYLFSNRNLRNVAYVDSNIGNVFVYADDTVTPYLTGRSRRMLYVDGGDVGDQDPIAFQQGLVQKGEIELAKFNREAIIETGIALQTPYVYGTDYFLGDKVTVIAAHGYEGTMLVNEYVRTHDRNGDRGFPSLVLAS